MKKVFIFGYYGFNNIGDEAILEAIVHQFRQFMPEVGLTVLSYHAEETSHRYGVGAVSRNRFISVFHAIRQSQLVMSGGGSILQDVTSSRSLMYYLGIILLAKILGKKVAFYGNGFGPITRPSNRFLVKHIINQVDLLTVRDEESAELMRELGIVRPIHITADAAFTLEVLKKTTSKKEGEPPQVGISVRRWKNQDLYIPIVAACADALADRGYRVCFLPMQTPADQIISTEIIDKMKNEAVVVETGDKPISMIETVSGMEFIIGMRLHSLVFSAIAGVPMIGLAYEAKITSFLKTVGQPCAGHVESITEKEMMSAVNDFLAKKEEYQQLVQRHQQLLKEKASVNTQMLRDYLMNGEAGP